MIYDKFENSNNQNYCTELTLGLSALKEMLPELLKIEGDEKIVLNSWMFFITQSGKKNIANVDSEVHKKNHDIFYLTQGRELSIFQGNFENYDDALKSFGNPIAHDIDFNDEKDIGFTSLAPTMDSTWNILNNEHFIHFAPGDYHASQIAMDNEPVRKIVVKILDKSFWDNTMSENTLIDDIEKLKQELLSK